MINLKQLILEGKKVKIHFRNVLPGGIDAAIDVEFQINTYDGRIIALPKTSKDLDKLETLQLNRDGVAILLGNILSDQLKEVELKYDESYHGAGYGFTVDLEKLVKKLK